MVFVRILSTLPWIMCRPDFSQSQGFQVTTTKVDFSVFEFDKHFWVGRHDVRWLAKGTFFIIDTEEAPIPPEQRVIVEFVCSLPEATRKKLEKCLFQSYPVLPV